MSDYVAPFTGARVETVVFNVGLNIILVAPFTGARVETVAMRLNSRPAFESLPSRERELKPKVNAYKTPLTGCRSLHGSAS